jgi:hypothetical protein
MSARTLLLTIAVAWLGTASPATAQIATPAFERGAHVFGHVGWFRAGSDEGAIGGGVSFGGGGDASPLGNFRGGVRRTSTLSELLVRTATGA